MEQSSIDKGKTDRVVMVLLGLVALVARVVAAWPAHPACGDALHFIEFGWKLAQGDLAGLSNYWSQGQILVAAGAFLGGFDPQRTLQAVTMAAGILTAPLLYVLVRRLEAPRAAGIVAALLVALNPFLINLSITGYSEIPYLAGWLWGAVFLLDAGGGRRRWLTAVLSGIGFGASIYFRMTDAVMLAALTLAMYGGLEWLIKRQPFTAPAGRVLLVGAVMAATLAPLSYHARLVSGTWLPSSSKVHTIVIGGDAYDSKWMYGLDEDFPWEEREAAYEEKGLVGYLWANRVDVARRAAGNLATIVRLSSGDLFVGPVRLGPVAFLVLVAGCAIGALRRGTWVVAVLALVLLAAHSLALSMYFIFPRYMATTVTLLALVIGAGAGWLSAVPSRQARMIVLLAGVMYLGITAHSAAQAFRLEFMWHHYARWVRVADDIAPLFRPDEVFMAQGVSAIAQRMGIYDRERFVEVPYEDLDAIAALCAAKGIRYVVASDSVRPHWPISEAVRNRAALPPPWRLVREWNFDGDPWIDPPETMVLLEINNSAISEPAAP